jgi:DNA-3-methyladenine glycosylase
MTEIKTESTTPCLLYGPGQPASFFERPTVIVAQDLLGCVLYRRLPGSEGRMVKALISEVEAYTSDDPACHAFRGKTKRTEVLFGPPGVAYVYFIYGMYHCLNVVTEPDQTAGAILIRALLSDGLNGPGKICREWQIDRAQNGVDMTDCNSEIWIGPRPEGYLPTVDISPRIGISQAKERLWRFFIPTEKKSVRIRKVKM